MKEKIYSLNEFQFYQLYSLVSEKLECLSNYKTFLTLFLQKHENVDIEVFRTLFEQIDNDFEIYQNLLLQLQYIKSETKEEASNV